jgi:uncharacterized membrane protein YraQ (UPF0718 family)
MGVKSHIAVTAVISRSSESTNVPLSAVLWNTGISFGGIIAFIFANSIVILVLDIYRKYYRVKIIHRPPFYAAMFGGAFRHRTPVSAAR